MMNYRKKPRATFNSVITKALNAPDSVSLQQIERTYASLDPFAQSAIHDPVQQILGMHGRISHKLFAARSHELLQSIAARCDALSHWDYANNKTIEAIQEGKIDRTAIVPHPRGSREFYSKYYREQSERYAKVVADERFLTPAYVDEYKRKKLENINHVVRRSHAIQIIEVLFALVAAASGERPVRWLDIGCGHGEIANDVVPDRYRKCEWSIVGADLQPGKIEWANRTAGKDRNFYCADCFEIIAKEKEQGNTFDIVSMFEFLEHLEDPLHFLSLVANTEKTFVVAASPLEQIIDRPRVKDPDPVHLWSYSKDGWNQLFRLAGLEPVYIAQINMGSFIGGLNWLAIICGPAELLRKHRTEWGPNAGL